MHCSQRFTYHNYHECNEFITQCTESFTVGTATESVKAMQGQLEGCNRCFQWQWQFEALNCGNNKTKLMFEGCIIISTCANE